MIRGQGPRCSQCLADQKGCFFKAADDELRAKLALKYNKDLPARKSSARRAAGESVFGALSNLLTSTGCVVAPQDAPVVLSDQDRAMLRGIALQTQEKLSQISTLLHDAVADNDRLLAALGGASKREVLEVGDDSGEGDEMVLDDNSRSFPLLLLRFLIPCADATPRGAGSSSMLRRHDEVFVFVPRSSFVSRPEQAPLFLPSDPAEESFDEDDDDDDELPSRPQRSIRRPRSPTAAPVASASSASVSRGTRSRGRGTRPAGTRGAARSVRAKRG